MFFTNVYLLIDKYAVYIIFRKYGFSFYRDWSMWMPNWGSIKSKTIFFLLLYSTKASQPNARNYG